MTFGARASGHARTLLRGIGQVIFAGNAASGALIVAAVGTASLRGNAVPVAVPALIAGALAGTLAATAVGAWREAVQKGLHGFNGALAALAVVALLPEQARWAPLAAAAAGALGAMLGRAARVPWLTAPFIAVSWGCLAGQPAGAPPPPAEAGMVETALRGLSQIFLIGDPLSGALILAAIAAASRRAALIAAVAAVAAIPAATLVGAPPAQIGWGLWGYSPVLTALAIGWAFPRPGWRGRTLTIAATLTTPVMQAALGTALAPTALPVLTAPFVLTTWLLLAIGRITSRTK